MAKSNWIKTKEDDYVNLDNMDSVYLCDKGKEYPFPYRAFTKNASGVFEIHQFKTHQEAREWIRDHLCLQYLYLKTQVVNMTYHLNKWRLQVNKISKYDKLFHDYLGLCESYQGVLNIPEFAFFIIRFASKMIFDLAPSEKDAREVIDFAIEGALEDHKENKNIDQYIPLVEGS